MRPHLTAQPSPLAMRSLSSRLPILIGLALLASACSSSPGGDADTAGDTLSDTAADGDATDVADTTAPTANVVINEVFVTGSGDWVELYNAGGAAADLSGWLFRDSDATHAYTFPPSTILPPGVFFLLSRDPDVAFDFGLGAADSALLYAGNTLVDGVTWTDREVPDGFSYGRFPDGSGPFATLFTPTPGAANQENPVVSCGDGARVGLELCDGQDFGGATCASLGFSGGDLACLDQCARIATGGCTAHAAGLVINEVTSVGDDRIELFNDTAASVDLTGWSLVDGGTNRWVFAPATLIAAGAYRVLTKGVDHDFGLGDDDLVELRDPTDATIDRADWAAGEADPSWCRVPNGTGGFVTCTTPSFGGANPAQ